MRRTLLISLLLLWPGLRPGMPAEPVIVLNNSTGSDTAASGAPSSFGPFSGVVACTTAGASTIILWAGTPAAIPVDGSAAMWLATGAGRRWSRIAAFTPGVSVTVADTFTIAAAVDCAVGGKRSSVTSVQLLRDFKTDWVVELENTGTNYLVAATVLCNSTVGGHPLVRGNQTTPRPIIEGTANSVLFTSQQCLWRDLHFINTNATKTLSIALDNGGTDNYVENCIIGSIGQGFANGIDGGTDAWSIWRNEVRGNGVGISMGAAGGNRPGAGIIWNWIHDNSVGVQLYNDVANGQRGVFRNLIQGNTGDGIQVVTRTGPNWIAENVINSNGGDGIDMGAFGVKNSIFSNQITNNGGFGITCTSGCSWEGHMGLVDWNNLFNNTLGPRNNQFAGPNDTATAPGYTGGTNFCPGSGTAGGPPGTGNTFPGSTTPSVLTQGACQRSGASAGGGNLGI